jgi:hypothetical protein
VKLKAIDERQKADLEAKVIFPSDLGKKGPGKLAEKSGISLSGKGQRLVLPRVQMSVGLVETQAEIEHQHSNPAILFEHIPRSCPRQNKI